MYAKYCMVVVKFDSCRPTYVNIIYDSDNNFDIPDRTFHSMNTAWRLSSYESTTDVKELIPEFFFLPDFLINKEGIKGNIH